ncbi:MULTISPECIES: hypothetical protein [Buttiauxella]|jgi:hypothetical protein|uniref:Uncharacterized protein n=1 Tax=Buttiauxella agrestis TaxID=82977 RepID=A0A381KN27_9ENTR|nr:MULTISPECIES: hypothetical protein [Buttiauxella]TDX12045.1 hypothetical protein EDF88_4643 [Buttiauxella sp. BIGb0552]SUY92770.1 Uncharacterised protein [Buttiauxella agrestis]
MSNEISNDFVAPDSLACEQVPSRLQLSKRASTNLNRAKEILNSRGINAVTNEEIIRAYLEEFQPLDIASAYLDNRLKQLSSSICDF